MRIKRVLSYPVTYKIEGNITCSECKSRFMISNLCLI